MSIIDYILPEDRAEYDAIISRAAEVKKNTPVERKARGPMTDEQKEKLVEGKLNKMKAKLAEMRAKRG